MGKVALVTGGNKGIGYEIVRGLSKKIEGHVLLGARNEELGKAAVARLKEEGLSAEFLQVDVTSRESIEKAKEHISNLYGGLDILVNNAGIAYKRDSTVPFAEQAESTINVNFSGTLNVSNAMFPLLRAGARVVNIASFNGALSQVSEKLREEFSSDNLTAEQLKNLMQKFVELTKEGKHQEAGFSSTAYGMSKVGVIALTRVHGREMAQDSRGDIIVTCACPGYVRTDMSGGKGNRSAEEGADTPIFLCSLPQGHKYAQGQFFQDRKMVNWLDMSVKEVKCPYMGVAKS